MQFILVPGSIEQLTHLRKNYETERKVDLEKKPSTLGWPTLFGGIDIKTRRKQITFLEKIQTILEHFFHTDEEIVTLHKFQENLMASRIMIAACLYIQNEIANSKENSVLYRLINKYLGITTKNFLDEEDKKSCYQTAYQLIKRHDALAALNQELRDSHHKELSETEWELFTKFITKEEEKRNSSQSPPNYFPVSTTISPIFEKAFSYVGLTIGWIAAGTASSSSIAITSRLELAPWIGSTLLFIGPMNIVGATLLATHFIPGFRNLNLSHISKKTGQFIGDGTGKVIGLPFDLAYNLLRVSGSLIANYCSEPPSLAPLTGLCIANGTIAVQGHPLQFNLVSQQQSHKPRLQITEEGKITIDGTVINNLDFDNETENIFKKLLEKNSQIEEDDMMKHMNLEERSQYLRPSL